MTATPSSPGALRPAAPHARRAWGARRAPRRASSWAEHRWSTRARSSDLRAATNASRGPVGSRGSVSRSALHIEYGAALALRTDEPLAAARVAEAERAAADRSRGERDVASRARGRLAGDDRTADALLLLGGVLRMVSHRAGASRSSRIVRRSRVARTPRALPRADRPRRPRGAG